MALRLKEWSEWSVIEKVTFVAQVATVISFPIAAGFSYLSWKEARLARDDQRLYFIEEKSPDLSVTSASALKMDGSENWLLRISLKNSGSSPAIKIRTRVASEDVGPPVGTIDPMTREPSEETVGRGREKDALVSIIRPLAENYRWNLNSLKLAGKDWPADYKTFATLEIRWEGGFNDIHDESYYLIAKQLAPTKR